MILSGFHPVREAARSRPRQIEWVLFDSSREDRRARQLQRLCRSLGVAVRYGERQRLDRLAGRSHQGVVARLAVLQFQTEAEAFRGPHGERFLLLLDQIQDPQNLGSILRVAEAVGASVVLPERGSSALSQAVARSSAGAVERVSVVRVGNLRRFLDHLKNQGFRVIGLDPAGTDLYRIDLTGDLALVLGAEEKGIRRLLREGCDFLARLPMKGELQSLNVASAAAAASYEVIRQREFSPKGLASRGLRW